MNDIYKIVEFSEDDKWFVVSTDVIDDIKYSCLIRINNNEDNFLDEYKVVRSYFSDDGEYMDVVNDKEVLQKIVPILVPDSTNYMNNPELREVLKDLLN